MNFLLVPGIAFVIAAAATPVVRWMALRAGRIAHPTADRWHARPVALLGGIAIFVGVAAGTLALLIGLPIVGGYDRQTLKFGAGILISSLLMFGAGLIDDLVGLKPTTKLILQAIAGAILVTTGAIFLVVPFTVVNVLLTVFWFIALTNATNLLDNMDGITAGVSAIAALGFAALFADQPLLSGFALAVAGASLGFLVFNFSRASIFMGDAGSLFLGSMLAGLGASYSAVRASHRFDSVILPALLVLVPVLDTLLVMSTRFLARIPVMQGGKDHTTHRLARVGLRDWQVAVVIYSVGTVATLLAISIARTSSPTTAWAGILFVLAVLVVEAYLAKLAVYPPQTEVPIRRVALLLDDLLYKRRILDVLVDLAVFACAYWGAFLLKWDGQPPVHESAKLASSVALVMGIRVAAFLACGVYQGRWHQVSVPDVHRVFRGTLIGTLVSWLIIGRLWSADALPSSLFLLDGVLVLLLAFGVRLSFRSLDAMRLHIGRRGLPTLIYGAGSGGELTVRELHANADLGLYPIGFLDDDPHKKGALILGIPVLGGVSDLSEIFRSHRIERIVIGTSELDSIVRGHLYESCRSAKVELLRLKLDLSRVEVGLEGNGAQPHETAGSIERRNVKAENGESRTATVLDRLG